MITIKEFYERVVELDEEYGDEYIGVRWEDKERIVGEEVNNSRHNIDREDERDMPEYGTPEYEEAFELDGSSAFGLYSLIEMFKRDAQHTPEKPLKSFFQTYHCYLIIGDNYTNWDDGLDDGEVVIENAKVMEVFY